MVTIKSNLANRKNYGQQRNMPVVKYIVIHYTANDGDTDESNGRYFHNNILSPGSSAHYFVDSDSATESVPVNYVAWAVGGSKWKGTTGARYYGVVNNTNSISIEICDDIKDGKYYPSQKTIENTLSLVEHLMKTYGIPKENVIRHYDVTGKPCPSYWIDDDLWRNEFWNKIGSNVKPLAEGNPYPKPVRTIYYDRIARKVVCTGDDVRWAQYQLRKAGYKTIDIDGRFGPACNEALGDFQSRNKLTKDYRLGPKTRKKLEVY